MAIYSEATKRSLKVLKIDINAGYKKLKEVYRNKMHEAHPDKGGSSEKFRAVKEAYKHLLTLEEFAESEENVVLQTREGIPLEKLGKGRGMAVNGITCEECKGAGYETFFEYDYFECERCVNGRVAKEYTCKACNGTGKFKQRRGKVVDCWKCSGTGIFLHPWHTETCPDCYGMTLVYKPGTKEAYRKCRVCEGTGEQVMENPVLPRAALGILDQLKVS